MTYNVSSTCNTHPATAIRGKLLVALGAMSAFGPVTTDIYLPSLPQAAAALNTTPTGIQSSLTVCLLGVAAGQLIAGPLSDSRGRRGPLLAAMAIFTLSSALCSTAANIATLDLFRLLQGGAGGAGIAICFAIVRDLCAGSAAARAYSILLAVSLVALIVAPTIGGQLLQITDWHGVFLTLTGLGLILLCCAYNWIPETLPIARRATGELATTMAALRQVTTDPGFTGYALTGGFSFAALFAYISAAPFIFEGPYHMSPQLFAALMALNGTGIVLANIVNARLLRRFSPLTMLDLGLAGVAVGATGVLLVLATTPHHLYTLLTPLFLMVASYGLTRPNSAALALDRHPDAAGSAAAIFGLILFAVGAIAAPATGLHQHNTISLGATVTTAAALAILARIMTWRTHHKPHHPPPQQPKTHQPTTNPHNPTTHHSNSPAHAPAIDIGNGWRNQSARVGEILGHDGSEWDALVDVATAHGWTLTHDKRNHPRLIPPDGPTHPSTYRIPRPVTLSSTNPEYRGVKCAAAQLRHMGLPMPQKRCTPTKANSDS